MEMRTSSATKITIRGLLHSRSDLGITKRSGLLITYVTTLKLSRPVVSFSRDDVTRGGAVSYCLTPHCSPLSLTLGLILGLILSLKDHRKRATRSICLDNTQPETSKDSQMTRPPLSPLVGEGRQSERADITET